jgi:hypothetical protein
MGAKEHKTHVIKSYSAIKSKKIKLLSYGDLLPLVQPAVGVLFNLCL